jgi:hypothetical protein
MRDIPLDIPDDAPVVLTGTWGSGYSSALAALRDARAAVEVSVEPDSASVGGGETVAVKGGDGGDHIVLGGTEDEQSPSAASG